jgi:multiple sugar transport system substrate-binding protein
MGTSSYSRRQFCQIGLASVASMTALGLAGCGSTGTSGSSQSTTLQLYFWGPASRNQLTKKAIQAYQTAHPNVTIHSAFSDWSSYWDKLNTQIAGGTIPDLIQMDLAYIAQYANQGVIMDLSDLIGRKAIDTTKQDTTLLENSKYNGKLYGIPLGGNYGGLVYDTDLVKEAGVGAPSTTMSYDQFASYTKELSTALKSKGIYGTVDPSGQIMNFEAWIRQLGKNLYTPDGKLGFEVADVAGWFDYWQKMRTSGACVPAQLQASVAGTSGPDSSLIIQGKAVFDVSWSNQFPSFQGLTKHTLALQMLPTGQQPSLYNKPSQLMSISTKSKNPEIAASFTDFIVNNAKGIQALGLDRGIPGNADAMTVLGSSLDTAQKATLSYMEVVEQNKQVRSLTILPPAGSGDVEDALQKVSQSVSFGQLSVSAGAQSFFQKATQALTK